MKLDKKILKVKVLNQNNEQVELKSYLSETKYLVLYFYPKDDTPGCTTEAKDFRDSIKQFIKLDTIVLGVSRDNCERHQKFIAKYDLNFELLADTNGDLCQGFGVLVEKSMFGKKYQGIERSTFILNQEGEIVAKWNKVKVKNHVADVLNVLQNI